MPPVPEHLPNDAWGFGSLLIICLSAIIMALAKRTDKATQSADNDDGKLQVVTDALTATMDAKLAERDARICELEAKFATLNAKYRSALRYARALTLIDPAAAGLVTIPAEIREDL